MSGAVNACVFCRKGKRKCDRAKPTCSNCTRLRRSCMYTEDSLQASYATEIHQMTFSLGNESIQQLDFLIGIDPYDATAVHQRTFGMLLRIIGGSLDIIESHAYQFFIGTHQRIPALSKFRFYADLQNLSSSPRAGFSALCLCLLLIQQMPSKGTTMRTQLYLAVKNLVHLLELGGHLSLDLIHCRVLVTFYEIGHGLHAEAYASVAAAARQARTLGLHCKPWYDRTTYHDILILEEQKRVWWAIVSMDRFLGLYNGEFLFVTDDPERKDPLPIDDLSWSESVTPADLEEIIASPPSLETPFTTTVGQMARECQIAHLVGRAVRHVFNPTSDPAFNLEEATQIERAMNSYLPLLVEEELRIGKYCGAFGMCNSALFMLYETALQRPGLNRDQRKQIENSMEQTSLRAIHFAEATYGDTDDNYTPEIYSPYLLYSLFQAAIVQYRLWKQRGEPLCMQMFDSMAKVIRSLACRWADAWRYLQILESISADWPPIMIPVQASFINNGRTMASQHT